MHCDTRYRFTVSPRKTKTKKQPSVFPKRSATHITGDRAVLHFKQCLPEEWIARDVPSDYGIDCEIKVVDDDGAVAGALVFAQLKGTEIIETGRKLLVQVKSGTVRYWISLPVPVIIVRVFDDPPKVLWLDVRQHLQDTGRLDGIFSTKQATISFNFAGAHVLAKSVDTLRDEALCHREAVLGMRDENDGMLVGDFVGYHILIHLFDGNIGRWKKWLREKGGDEQLVHDYPFAVWVESQLADDPDLLNRIKAMVQESSAGRSGTKNRRKRKV